MPAYLIVEHLITDPARFEQYRSKVVPMIERFGGRYLTRGGSHQILEGTWKPTRVAIIEFPDMATLRAFYEAPEYQPLFELRRGTGTDVVISIEGV
jgi:uncharacterized protein (DUF1330 family)